MWKLFACEKIVAPGKIKSGRNSGKKKGKKEEKNRPKEERKSIILSRKEKK